MPQPAPPAPEASLLVQAGRRAARAACWSRQPRSGRSPTRDRPTRSPRPAHRSRRGVGGRRRS
eukprot:176065-Lingulodinium_polyedra.AAC.1